MNPVQRFNAHVPLSYIKWYRRARRGIPVFWKCLVAAEGLSGKWAMFRCVTGLIRARLGWPGRVREVTIRDGDIHFTVDIYSAEIVPFWEMWFENAYEQLEEFRAKENWRIVDVGGNVGFYAIRQARRLRTGSVVVFEPSPAAFSRLQRNVTENSLRNITLLNAAVGSSCQLVYFDQRRRSVNSRIVAEKTNSTTVVPCTTLERELIRLGIDHVDILKIDTEGAERAVLSGAAGILDRVDRIVLELHGDYDRERYLITEMLQPHGLHHVGQHGTLAFYARLSRDRFADPRITHWAA